MKPEFKNILIYGMGLMGASLSLAIKSKKLQTKVTGVVRSEKSKKEGIKNKIADAIFLEEEFLESGNWNEFDLIVFSLPVDLTCDKIDRIPAGYTGYLTDLGSTKKSIIERVEKRFKKEHNYFSSHPMTGSEQSGLNFAREDLYENRLCILTAPKRVSLHAVEKMTNFWKSLGSITIEMNAKEHDEVLAYLSHSPHILSSLLVNWAYGNPHVKRKTIKSPVPLTGGGFRDMTRIAGSNPDMWNAIINTNKDAILKSLYEYRDGLELLIEKLETDKSNTFWKKYFQKSKKSRSAIFKLNEMN